MVALVESQAQHTVDTDYAQTYRLSRPPFFKFKVPLIFGDKKAPLDLLPTHPNCLLKRGPNNLVHITKGLQ